MSSEERSHINNGIWLCGTHADLIDRDTAHYTIDALQQIKREHEAAIAQELRGSAPKSANLYDLIAIGPNVICTGQYTEITESSWTLQLQHFVAGEIGDVVGYIDEFQATPADDRYLLVNEIGDGRVLCGPPALIRADTSYAIRCPVAPAFGRIRAQELGSQWATSPTTHDLYIENGQIARVSGVAALPQRLRECLSLQRGEVFRNPRIGARSAEYYGVFAGSPWLDRLLKLEIIRHAAIARHAEFPERTYLPIPCIERVRDVQVLSERPDEGRVRVRVDLDVKGIGRWSDEISVLVELNRSQFGC